MDAKKDAILPAIKFLTLDTEHICRLCFASTENEAVSLDDRIYLLKPYINETVSFADMFNELSVPLEGSLPQLLCVNCATMTTDSYLFKKLCQYSNDSWGTAVARLNTSLNQADSIGPKIQTIYMMIKDDNLLFTSKKHCDTKKQALTKIKVALKAKRPSNQKSNAICEECGGQFMSRYHLIKHMITHDSHSRFPCLQCPKVFNTNLKLTVHTERVHFLKSLACPKCSQKFSTPRMLRIHNQQYHVGVICKLCCVQFPSRRALRAHLDKHDLNKCLQCSKSFKNKQTFRLHQKICGNTENRLRKFCCDICSKIYVTKNGLRSHMKRDHGFGKVLTCTWCNKRFDGISKLNAHIVKHTRERNFHCEQCGGKFVTLAALVYHTRLHTGERPFPCDLCSESFLSASRRMEHKRRKHFGPTQECHICHVKFVTGHSLRKHVERHYNPHSKLFVPETVEPYTVFEIVA